MQSFASKTIDAPIEKVFSVAENYPHFVGAFNVKKTLYSDESKVRVQVGTVKFGRQFVWEGEGIKDRNNQIDFTQTNGLFKGLKAIWRFKKLDSNKTAVEIETLFNSDFLLFKGLLENLSKKYLIENTTVQILEHLKIQSELNA